MVANSNGETLSMLTKLKTPTMISFNCLWLSFLKVYDKYIQNFNILKSKSCCEQTQGVQTQL